MSNSLSRGQGLRAGQQVVSNNGRVLLTMQSDGNLVLYRSSDRKPLWASNTAHARSSYVVMQDDGNLVISGNDGRPCWSTETSTSPGSRCVLQDDGDLVIYSAQNREVWASNTAQDWNGIDLTNIHRRPDMYFLKNMETGLHLCGRDDVVYARTPSNSPAEKWVRSELINGFSVLYNLASARRLGNDEPGYVYVGDGGDRSVGKPHQWALERHNESFFVRNVETQCVLDTMHQNIFTKPRNGAVSQKWELTKTAWDGSAEESFRRAVRALFEKSENHHVVEPLEGVDVQAEMWPDQKMYVKTTIKYFGDCQEFFDEFGAFFEATQGDESSVSVIVSSEGFSDDVYREAESWGRVRTATHEDVTRWTR